ncbi:MAG: hypothetical protein QFB87_05450 [Patescibacteria group bacterium]|nr:hypothetical protein [Patescibacteria group bacterium]
MPSKRHLYLAAPVVLIGFVCGGAGLAAASSANISHSYLGSNDIVQGSLVSLDSTQDNYVQAANTNTANKLVGITVGTSDSLVAIDAEANKVQVATSGIASALVSDVNGPIKSGDSVAVSPFSGVGMKSQPGARLIGLAQSTLGDAGSNPVNQQVTDKDGKKQTIKVGFVRVSIAIGSAPANADDAQRNSLQRVAKSLTGHAVSTARIVISAFIAVIALIALVTLIYTSVYGSIEAIGRNPLAKTSIFRALTSIIGLVLATATVALITIYLIIR